MKKKAEELNKGDKIKLTDRIGLVEEIEISELGKQGKRKCRIAVKVGEESLIIIRPEGYPVDVL